MKDTFLLSFRKQTSIYSRQTMTQSRHGGIKLDIHVFTNVQFIKSAQENNFILNMVISIFAAKAFSSHNKAFANRV